MAQVSIRKTTNLDEGLVLTPERYDPRVHARSTPQVDAFELAAIAEFRKEMVSPDGATISNGQYLVFDTGDAKDGYLTIGDKKSTERAALGSSKKVIRAGDVIVSRLRPYLRQVAWLDGAVELTTDGRQVTSAASTEFYVLRSREARSIAFLVPFLLSQNVQNILMASQEGGHHPRVPQATIAKLVVPGTLLAARDELSARVEAAVEMARRSEQQLSDLVATVDTMIDPVSGSASATVSA